MITGDRAIGDWIEENSGKFPGRIMSESEKSEITRMYWEWDSQILEGTRRHLAHRGKTFKR